MRFQHLLPSPPQEIAHVKTGGVHIVQVATSCFDHCTGLCQCCLQGRGTGTQEPYSFLQFECESKFQNKKTFKNFPLFEECVKVVALWGRTHLIRCSHSSTSVPGLSCLSCTKCPSPPMTHAVCTMPCPVYHVLTSLLHVLKSCGPQPVRCHHHLGELRASGSNS